jgi:nitrogen-specific signal transduction histidine kinase
MKKWMLQISILPYIIAGSLLMLGLLETFWLGKLYDDEKKSLQSRIKQELRENILRSQFTKMQSSNAQLIDSFFEQKTKDEERQNAFVSFGKKGKLNAYTIDAFIKERQGVYLEKLDTLSQLKLGSGDDNQRIDSFLNTMKIYYTNLNKNTNIKPQTERDSNKRMDNFIQNQRYAYTGLWHIYRLPFSPQLHRKSLDSFFRELKNFQAYESMDFWSLVANQYTSKKTRTHFPKSGISFNSEPSGVSFFISTDTNKNRKLSKKDSMVSVYSYQFQDFVTAMIEPESVKKYLDTTFSKTDAAQLSFNVFRLKSDSMIPKNGDALLVTSGGGERGFSKQKITVAAYGYKSLIIKKLYLEIGFAVLVFALISFSFFLIYKSLKNQEKLTQLKNDFISNITHELKTPITTVGVAIEALSNFDALKNPEQTREYLHISKNELSRLGLLVENILRVTAFDQKEFELKLEKLDLADVIAEVLDSMKLLFEKYQANVTFNVPSDVDFTLKGDRTHLTSVVYNLVENALKYGGKNIIVEMTTPPQYSAEKQVVFSVKDDGAGISKEYQEKVFEKFFRVPTGNVHNTKGYGLGLSYVAGVVAKHNGHITLMSEEGVGSQFIVYLPT